MERVTNYLGFWAALGVAAALVIVAVAWLVIVIVGLS